MKNKMNAGAHLGIMCIRHQENTANTNCMFFWVFFFFFVCDEIGAVGGRPTTAGISERLQHSVFFISVPVA